MVGDCRCVGCDDLMKGADSILCTVIIWLFTILPLLLAVEGMSFVEHGKQHTSEVAAQFSEEGLTLFVLGVSAVVFVFSLRGLRVLWPTERLEGELPQHDVDCHSNRRRILIVYQATNPALGASSVR